MILQNTDQNNIIIEGDIISSNMRISETPEIQDFIIKFLTQNGYKRGIESTTREIYCNNLDAMVAVGKKESPVFVRIKQDDLNNWFFETEDEGVSLTPEEFEQYVMGIGESSKRNSNDYIGAMGCGSKAFLSVSDTGVMVCRKNGVETKYLIFKGKKRPEKTILYSKETIEKDGVITTIPIDRWQVNKWVEAVKSQLCYFPNIIYEYKNEDLNNFQIYRNELFEWNSNYPKQYLHISLNGVPYPIDWDSLGISQIYIPIGIRIGLDEGVTFTFNREELNWTESTINLIKDKIKLVSEWFVNKYNEEVKEFESLLKGWEFINVHDKSITLESKKFDITELEKFSDIKFLEPKVKGIELLNPIRFKTMKEHLLKGYSTVGQVKWNGTMSNKGRTEEGLIREYIDGNKSLLIDNNLSGYFRDYIKTLGFKHFVKKNIFNYDLPYYKQILSLREFPKTQWRDIIVEWQTIKEQFCKELFVDGSNYHTSKEFLTYKENNKTVSRSSSISNYKRLDKQKGEITINSFQLNRYANDFKTVKSTMSVSDLHKQPYLSIVFDYDNRELCKQYCSTFRNIKHLRFIFLGVKDYKLVSSLNIKNIKMFAKIKPKEVKSFRNLATAALFNKTLVEFESIYYNASQMIQNSMDELYDAKIALKQYTDKYSEVKDNDLSKDIICQCTDYDQTLFSEYKLLLQANKDLSFLKYVSKPSKWSSEYEKFESFVNEELLLRKLTNRYDLSQFEVIKKEVKVEEEILELV